MDGIKFPRRYSSMAAKDPFIASLMWAFLSMAGSIGLDVVIEGLEDEKDVSFFKGLSVKLIQGFYYSRPLTVEQVPSFMTRTD